MKINSQEQLQLRKHIKFTEHEKEQIISLWKQGKKATEICRTVDSLNDRKPQTIYPILIKAGLYKKKPANDLRRYKVNDAYFDKIDNEHKAYWLGFMLADGYLVNSGHATESFGMTLDIKDKYILKQLQKDLETDYPIHEYESHNAFDGKTFISNNCKIIIKSKRIFARLKELGFCTDKSHNAYIPEDSIPPELLHHFVRGYFDGDGSLAKSGGKYHTYDFKLVGTYEVIHRVMEILGKNVKLTQRFPERDNNNWQLNLCGDKQVFQICQWMYDGATIYLERKFERYQILSKKYE